MRDVLLPVRAGVCAAAVAALAVAAPSERVSGQAQPAAPSADLVEDLVAGYRILANEGIVDVFGHVSVRHDRRPDRFLLSRDLAPALVTAADLLEYDLDGNPVGANAPRGYSERFIHAAIYRARPDVGSVVHAHTPSVVAFANSDVPLRPMYHIAWFLLGGVPTYEIRSVPGHRGMLVNDMRSAAALAETLGDRVVALMRGHGYVTVGSVIPEAVHRSIVLDINARMQMQAVGLGGAVRYLTEADVAGVPPSTTDHVRGWPLLKERALRR